ncbi:MAG: TrkH family potassium uptake protein, partial [Clostridia bacterium]|nr:TrkH family potassium uptake protein [Clostridia bacterium]
YFMSYIFIFCISVLLVSLNGFDFETTFTSVLTAINNVGPGLGKVGPLGNFYELSNFSKIILSFDMLLGRLEIFPIIMLFSPSVWGRR